MKRAKYFTVDEANGLLPLIRPLVEQLLEKRAKASRLSQQMPQLMEDVQSDVGGRRASQLYLMFGEIERLTQNIEQHGCVVKNLHAGIVDFLADHNGRDVFLCWKYGESTVAHFHDLHTGFNGRQPIPTNK